MNSLSYCDHIVRELADTPARVQREVLDFLLFVKQRAATTPNTDEDYFPGHLLSEAVLSRDWLTPEEDEAWKDL